MQTKCKTAKYCSWFLLLITNLKMGDLYESVKKFSLCILYYRVVKWAVIFNK